MLTKVVSFFTSPLGGILLKVVGGIAALGLVYGAYTSFVHGVENRQLIRDQNAQLQQLARDMQTLHQKEQALEAANTQIVQQLNERNNRVDVRYRDVTHYIASPEAQRSNRPSSDVIRETIRRLTPTEGNQTNAQ